MTNRSRGAILPARIGKTFFNCVVFANQSCVRQPLRVRASPENVNAGRHADPIMANRFRRLARGGARCVSVERNDGILRCDRCGSEVVDLADRRLKRGRSIGWSDFGERRADAFLFRSTVRCPLRVTCARATCLACVVVRGRSKTSVFSRLAGVTREDKDMRSKRLSKKLCILAGASLLAFGSCLNLDQVLRFGTLFSVSEFLLDGGVLDIFPDGP